MKILKNKGRIVFIATGPVPDQDKCPRLIVNDGINEIRDDYKGSIKISKELLLRFSEF
jgi:hypothetical protein